MNLLTHVFYLISTALLIPVMLALLWSLFQVLLILGQAFREYLQRSRDRAICSAWEQVLSQRAARLPQLPSPGLVSRTLAALQAAAQDPLLLEKHVQEAENAWRDELERITALARRGPALGLMGTLIPLGPALVGLAAGDLQMMSENLVLAFATTVVGLLVGTLAGWLASTKRRWYRRDAGLVAFTASRLFEGLSGESASAAWSGERARRAGVIESPPGWADRSQVKGKACASAAVPAAYSEEN